MQIRLCMTRGFQRLAGDKLFTAVTIAAMFIMALVLGSIFYDLAATADTLNSKCILLYFAILFNALSSALEVRCNIAKLHVTLNT
jgi:ATP-binding cassette, subfamily G (WHITE), member 2, PDR